MVLLVNFQALKSFKVVSFMGDFRLSVFVDMP